MANIQDWFLYWQFELQSCYTNEDINTAWYMKYEVTQTLQHFMDTQTPFTQQNMEMMKNLLKLESEISLFIYLVIEKQRNNVPLDCSFVTLERR